MVPTSLPVYKGQEHKQRHRRQQTVKQLRQIFSKIGLQLFHTFRRHLHHLGSSRFLSVRSSQTKQLAVNLISQNPLYIHTGPVGGMGHPPVADKTKRHGNQYENTVTHSCPQCHFPKAAI